MDLSVSSVWRGSSKLVSQPAASAIEDVPVKRIPQRGCTCSFKTLRIRDEMVSRH